MRPGFPPHGGMPPPPRPPGYMGPGSLPPPPMPRGMPPPPGVMLLSGLEGSAHTLATRDGHAMLGQPLLQSQGSRY